MNKNEVTYERDITASYMKVPMVCENSIDVRILFHHMCKGLIPMERCFMKSQGEFWYDISGKQALDSFIKFQPMEYTVFERIILRICEQIEILEWNLLDVNGLLLDPEFIFLSNKGNDVSFIFYPQSKTSVLKELRSLVEYLLSKLDHRNHELIQGAYDVYEITLQEGYNLQEIKESILKNRVKTKPKEEYVMEPDGERIAENEIFYKNASTILEEKQSNKTSRIEEKLTEMYHNIKHLLKGKQKESPLTVVYPQEEEIKETVIHPTVCIASVAGEPKGLLLYEGRENYMDMEMDKKACMIGKNSGAQLRIERDTISNIHAKIEYRDGYYIEDMNSTNGTYVNDEILNYKESRLLCVGDMIRFADVKYRFL